MFHIGQSTFGNVKPSSDATNKKFVFGTISEEDKNISLIGTIPKSTQTSFDNSNITFGSTKPMDCGSETSTQQQSTPASPFNNSEKAFGSAKPMDSGSKTSTQQQSTQASCFGQSNTAFGTPKPMDCGSKINTQQECTKASPFGHSEKAFGFAKPMDYGSKTSSQPVFGGTENTSLFGTQQQNSQKFSFGCSNIAFGSTKPMDCGSKTSTQQQSIQTSPFGSSEIAFGSVKPTGFDFKTNKQTVFGNLASSQPLITIFGNENSLDLQGSCGNGTMLIKYQPLVVIDTFTKMNPRHQCITAMKEYERKSLEELRMEDYLKNPKWSYVNFINNLSNRTKSVSRDYLEPTKGLFKRTRKPFFSHTSANMNKTDTNATLSIQDNQFFPGLFSKPSEFGGFDQTTQIFGNTQPIFGKTTLGLAPGTAFVKYQPLIGTENNIKGEFKTFKTKHHYITAMTQYSGKSTEELRWEDYLFNQEVHRKGLGKSLHLFGGITTENRFDCSTGFTNYPQPLIKPSMFGQQNQTVKIDFGRGTSFLIQQIPQTSCGSFGQSNSNVFGFGTPQISFSQTPSMFGQQNQTVKIDFGGGTSFLIQQIPQTSCGSFGQSNSNVFGFGTPQISFSQTPSMFGQQNQTVKIDFGRGTSFLIQQIPQTSCGSFGQSNSNVFGFGTPQISFSQTPSMFGQQNQTVKIDFGRGTSFLIQQIPQTSCGSFGQSNSNVFGFGTPQISFSQTPSMFGQQNQTVKIDFGGGTSFFIQQIPQTRFGNSDQSFADGNMNTITNSFNLGSFTSNGFRNFGLDTKKSASSSILFGNSPKATFDFDTGFKQTIPLESGFGFGKSNTSCFGSTDNKFGAGQTFGSSNNFQTQPKVSSESVFGFEKTNTSCFGSTDNKFGAGQPFGNSNNFQTQAKVPSESGFGFGKTNTSCFGSTDNKFGAGQPFGNSNSFQTQAKVPSESGFGFGKTNTPCFGSTDNKFGAGQTFGTNNAFGGFQQKNAFLNRQPNVTLKISPDGIEIINFQLS